jgi:hypothetical protein
LDFGLTGGGKNNYKKVTKNKNFKAIKQYNNQYGEQLRHP